MEYMSNHVSVKNTRSGTLLGALCALMAAVTAVCSQIQIPLPMIPINLALFSVHLSGILLGPKYGSVSQAVYILLAAVGVPVLAGFSGGLGALFGRTGGYAVGYILCAGLDGLLCRKWGASFGKMCAAMALGCAACYALGTVWFMAVTGLDIRTSLVSCVLPFLPGDAVKIVLAGWLALRVRPALQAMLK